MSEPLLWLLRREQWREEGAAPAAAAVGPPIPEGAMVLVVEAAPVAELLKKLLRYAEGFEDDRQIIADSRILLSALRKHESRPS